MHAQIRNGHLRKCLEKKSFSSPFCRIFPFSDFQNFLQRVQYSWRIQLSWSHWEYIVEYIHFSLWTQLERCTEGCNVIPLPLRLKVLTRNLWWKSRRKAGRLTARENIGFWFTYLLKMRKWRWWFRSRIRRKLLSFHIFWNLCVQKQGGFCICISLNQMTLKNIEKRP